MNANEDWCDTQNKGELLESSNNVFSLTLQLLGWTACIHVPHINVAVL